MIKNGLITFGVLFAALLVATPAVNAQFPGLPPLPPKPTHAALPTRDVSTEVAKMTKRYGLSDDQAQKITAILNDQKQKADGVAKDDSLVPVESLHRLLSIKDEEIARVSDVLTPEQRKKYLADVHPSRPSKGLPADGAASSSQTKE